MPDAGVPVFLLTILLKSGKSLLIWVPFTSVRIAVGLLTK
jgi:hypothetical protein